MAKLIPTEQMEYIRMLPPHMIDHRVLDMQDCALCIDNVSGEGVTLV